MTVRYRVDLSEAERGELQALTGGGRQAVRKVKRAQILLAADAGPATRRLPPAWRSARPRCTGPGAASSKATWTRRWVSSRGRGRRASCRARRKPCWWRPPAPGPPEGRARWTLELLAGALVRLTEHEICRARRCAAGWPRTT